MTIDKKVINLSRFFDNSDVNLEMSYSEYLTPKIGYIKLKSGKIRKAKWQITYKAELGYEKFKMIFQKYSLAESINVEKFMKDCEASNE